MTPVWGLRTSELADAATSTDGLGWLALTVVVSAGVAGLVNLAFARLNVGFVKKKELEASVSSALDQEYRKRELERSERVRSQVLSMAGPIEQAAKDLLWRLDNLIDGGGDAPLDPAWGDGDRTWSMSHEYTLYSTEYVFARFFSYSEILRDSLGSDLRWDQADKDELLESMAQVGKALSEHPLPRGEDGDGGEDAQIFFWQQRALGSLVRSKADTSRVLNYAEFLDEVPSIGEHLQPLGAMLTPLPTTPRTGCHWTRMLLARQALHDVVDRCQALLAQPSVGGGRPAPVGGTTRTANS